MTRVTPPASIVAGALPAGDRRRIPRPFVSRSAGLAPALASPARALSRRSSRCCPGADSPPAPAMAAEPAPQVPANVVQPLGGRGRRRRAATAAGRRRRRAQPERGRGGHVQLLGGRRPTATATSSRPRSRVPRPGRTSAPPPVPPRGRRRPAAPCPGPSTSPPRCATTAWRCCAPAAAAASGRLGRHHALPDDTARHRSWRSRSSSAGMLLIRGRNPQGRRHRAPRRRLGSRQDPQERPGRGAARPSASPTWPAATRPSRSSRRSSCSCASPSASARSAPACRAA